jgi:hypothetical protein
LVRKDKKKKEKVDRNLKGPKKKEKKKWTGKS